MTAYTLIGGATAVGAAGTPSRQPYQVAQPGGGAGTRFQNPVNQSIQVVVTGSGNVSATVHWQVSNDGVNWFDYPTVGTITVASGASPQQNNAAGNTPYQYFSAYVSAISGTNASVTATMSA